MFCSIIFAYRRKGATFIRMVFRSAAKRVPKRKAPTAAGGSHLFSFQIISRLQEYFFQSGQVAPYMQAVHERVMYLDRNR